MMNSTVTATKLPSVADLRERAKLAGVDVADLISSGQGRPRNADKREALRRIETATEAPPATSSPEASGEDDTFLDLIAAASASVAATEEDASQGAEDTIDEDGTTPAPLLVADDDTDGVNEVGKVGVQLVPLEECILDPGVQSRVEVDELTVAEYAEAYNEGVAMPPIVVFGSGGKYCVADGFHRVLAAQQAGKLQILAEVHVGGVRDATLHSAAANAAHGKRRTNADKRRAAEMLVADPEWSRWSDREIARQCRVSHTLVSVVRTELSGGACQIDPDFLEAQTSSDADAQATVVAVVDAGAKEQAGEEVRQVTRGDTTYQMKVGTEKRKKAAAKAQKAKKAAKAAKAGEDVGEQAAMPLSATSGVSYDCLARAHARAADAAAREARATPGGSESEAGPSSVVMSAVAAACEAVWLAGGAVGLVSSSLRCGSPMGVADTLIEVLAPAARLTLQLADLCAEADPEAGAACTAALRESLGRWAIPAPPHASRRHRR